MALPEAIQRQADEAAAAEAALGQQTTAPSEVVLTDPSQLQSQQAPQPATQPTPPAPPAEDWQQKYKSLQGMFAQRTGELQAQTKRYESQMAAMQQQIDTLLQAATKGKPADKDPVDPKDIENFGADMIEMVKRYAEQTARALEASFGKRIEALEHQVNGVSTRTEQTLEQQFYATLTKLVPDWEQTNKDPRWLAWLADNDPVYGAPRQAALEHAYQIKDAQRVANVFNAFAAAHPVRPKGSLADQVAPNGAATPAPTPAQAKPILTSKFVEKFYNELAKGRYAGREKEAAQIEAEINQAAAEGRIR